MDLVRLRSGRQVAIRPIGPDDGPSLQVAYRRLSERSKYSRFLALKPHLTTSEARYLVGVDGTDHVALVATPPDDPAAAELAIVVGDAHQRDGLATVLMERLAAVAEERGIHRFHATMLAADVAAHRLVRSMAGEVVGERREGTVDEIDINLLR